MSFSVQPRAYRNILANIDASIYLSLAFQRAGSSIADTMPGIFFKIKLRLSI